MWKARLDEAQAGIKIIGRNINNLRYADDTTLMAESEEELKSFLMKVKEESEKTGLKLNIQKMKTMAPVPSLHGKQMGKQCKQWQTLFPGLQNNCSHETKRRLLPGRKAMTNPDSILNTAEILLCQQSLVKVMVFPVVMYGCESWTIKKTERQRIDVFELCGPGKDSWESLAQQQDQTSPS